MSNVRPSKDHPGYSPQRDLAYVYPNLLAEVAFFLDERNWSEEIRSLCTAGVISEQELAETCRCFIDGLNMFIRDRSVDCPSTALELSGFSKLRRPLRMLYFYVLGTSLTAGWFLAVRDVTIQGEKSDAHDLLVEMRAAARAFYNKANQDFAIPDIAVEKIKAERDELQRVLSQLREREAAAVNTSAEAKLAALNLSSNLADVNAQLSKFLSVISNLKQRRLLRAVLWLLTWVPSFSGVISPLLRETAKSTSAT